MSSQCPDTLQPVAPLRIPRKTRSLSSTDLLREPRERLSLPSWSSWSDTPRKSNSLPVPPSIRHLPPIKPPSPQDIRPLPLPPTPTLAACRTIRPLPSPPTTPDSPSEPKLEICITPAAPLIPPLSTPHVTSSSFPKPKPHASLCLQTSLDVLLPTTISEEDEDWATSPLTPSVPQRPSPSVAGRKRMSKLRRHLGESVMFPLTNEQMAQTPRPLSRLKPSLSEKDDDTHDLTSVVFHNTGDDEEKEGGGGGGGDGGNNNNEEDLEDDMSTSDDESLVTLDDDESDRLWVVDGSSFRTAAHTRYSKKWVREKGGHRWEEEDYKHILRALRSL